MEFLRISITNQALAQITYDVGQTTFPGYDFIINFFGGEISDVNDKPLEAATALRIKPAAIDPLMLPLITSALSTVSLFAIDGTGTRVGGGQVTLDSIVAVDIQTP